jgi:hypothetical protein
MFRINCKQIKQLLESQSKENRIVIKNNILCENSRSTLEVHENVKIAENMLLDIRTYICAQGKCLLQHNRSHRRISNYNWKKMLKSKIDLNAIATLANSIISKKTTESQDTLTRSAYSNINNVPTNYNKIFNPECAYCLNIKLNGIKHMHYMKGEQTNKSNTHNIKPKYEPIETVFTKIDKKADNNAMKSLSKQCPNPPANKTQLNNNYRMSYGDLNYLGNNKALLYFNRGIRGIQTYTNSTLPLSTQPKYKDTIIVDDIVFTSDCKCESALQHSKMFPHYRVTCAVGLTCPAKLNNFEIEIYKRSRNASTEMFTKASAMLIRQW